MDDENQSLIEKKKRSGIWNYFEILNDEDKSAVCKQCNELFSYKSTVSNLKKHLVRKHPDVTLNKTSDDDDDSEEHLEAVFLEDEEAEDILNNDKRKVLRNGAWEYFEVTDEELKKAVCRLCSEEFSYRTTSTNLTRHLKSRHHIEFKNSDDEEQDVSPPETKTRGRSSISWDYFTIKDPERRLAVCKLCDNQLSYLTSVSNLMKHVRRKHGVKSDHDDAQYDSDEKVEGTAGRTASVRSVLARGNSKNVPPSDDSWSSAMTRSSVWLYFKSIDKVAGIAMCLICKKRLSHLTSTSNLKRHLYRKHPQITLDGGSETKKMLISSDGQLYEIEENNPKHEQDSGDDGIQTAEPMEIYLDEIEGNVIEKQPMPNARKKRKAYKRIVIDDEKDSTSDEEKELTYQKRFVRRKKDSLDQFGIYLVSLLRQLPKNVSNTLQAEFIKQIMSCQNPEGKVDNETEYAITITERPSEVTVTSASNDDNVFVVQTSDVA